MRTLIMYIRFAHVSSDASITVQALGMQGHELGSPMTRTGYQTGTQSSTAKIYANLNMLLLQSVHKYPDGYHREVASRRAPRTTCSIVAGSYDLSVHHGGVPTVQSSSGGCGSFRSPGEDSIDKL